MHRTWWFTWVKVAVLALALVIVFRAGYGIVKDMLSPYITEVEADQEPAAPEQDNIVTKLVDKVQNLFHVEIDYENLIFDYANEYAMKMMEESDEERHAVSEPLS